MVTRKLCLKYLLGVALGSVLMLAGCGQMSDSYEKAPVSSYIDVVDKESLYDEELEKPVMYLTVGRNTTGIDPEKSWNEINAHSLSWYEENGKNIYDCDALVQFGNEDGPTSDGYGYTNMSSNATVRLSGIKASERQQKSYRIKINSGSGNIGGIKTLILQKSFNDPFRFTNKLCFDLMSETEHMMSVRTGFVHLYVKDETESKDGLFEDYGMYTMIETVNKKYLSNRDLDSSGELYKVIDFDFARHEDAILQPTDANYDKKLFEQYLEAKGSNDYSKLIRLLEAVEDEDTAIEDIIEEYFDKDNLYTWMAFNILMNNKDTATENFYLYSPTGTNKFYIIPWDNDSALRGDYEKIKDPDYKAGWETGIYIYAGSKLFDRMIRSKACVNELSDRIDELHAGVLAPEHVSEKAKELADMVKPQVYKMPDMIFARVTQDGYDALVERLAEQIEENYDAYYESILKPWPFHIYSPENKDGHVVVSWENSTVLEGSIAYNVMITDAWDFNTRIRDERNITQNSFDMGNLPAGQYFVSVQAVSAGGKTQEAYEYYNTEQNTKVHGVLCFYVLKDGTVVQPLYEED